MGARLRAACPSIVLGALLLAAASLSSCTSRQEEPLPRFIAHAGGGIDGRRYCDCLDALEANHALGHRWFELDFSWTSDGQLVLIHDWDLMWRLLFQGEPNKPPTRAEFLQLPMARGQRQLDLAGLLQWLKDHPQARIVTDFKEDSLRGLALLAAAAPDMRDRFIPQIYLREELAKVRALGFEHALYTLYRSPDTPEEVVRFAAETGLLGVVTYEKRGGHARLMKLLREARIPVYLHTINDPEEAEALFAQGVTGVYTDFLHPPAATR